MQLQFTNQYGPRIWICVSFHSPTACAGAGDWGTRGWWTIDFGQSAFVLDTVNPRAYFYAEAEDGAFWAGSEWAIYAPRAVFDSCLNNYRSGDRYLGMRTLDLPPNGLTLNLVR